MIRLFSFGENKKGFALIKHFNELDEEVRERRSWIFFLQRKAKVWYRDIRLNNKKRSVFERRRFLALQERFRRSDISTGRAAIKNQLRMSDKKEHVMKMTPLRHSPVSCIFIRYGGKQTSITRRRFHGFGSFRDILAKTFRNLRFINFPNENLISGAKAKKGEAHDHN